MKVAKKEVGGLKSLLKEDKKHDRKLAKCDKMANKKREG